MLTLNKKNTTGKAQAQIPAAFPEGGVLLLLRLPLILRYARESSSYQPVKTTRSSREIEAELWICIH
jgi:hypothetical protein